MTNEYEVSETAQGRPTLIIRRKPSDIPIHIDMEVTRIAGMAHMDGPNGVCCYEFIGDRGEAKLAKAEEHMQMCGWSRKV